MAVAWLSKTPGLLQCLAGGQDEPARPRSDARRPRPLRRVGKPAAIVTAGALVVSAAVSSLARLRTRSTMARRALASEMRTNALFSSRPSRLRRNSTIDCSRPASRRSPAVSSAPLRRRGSFLVEKLHWNTQHLRKIEQPAGADAVDAFLVLLDLLEGQTELLAELLLAHAEQHAAKAHPAADMNIDGIGRREPFFYFAHPASHRHSRWSRHLSPTTCQCTLLTAIGRCRCAAASTSRSHR